MRCDLCARSDPSTPSLSFQATTSNRSCPRRNPISVMLRLIGTADHSPLPFTPTVCLTWKRVGLPIPSSCLASCPGCPPSTLSDFDSKEPYLCIPILLFQSATLWERNPVRFFCETHTETGKQHLSGRFATRVFLASLCFALV